MDSPEDELIQTVGVIAVIFCLSIFAPMMTLEEGYIVSSLIFVAMWIPIATAWFFLDFSEYKRSGEKSYTRWRSIENYKSSIK